MLGDGRLLSMWLLGGFRLQVGEQAVTELRRRPRALAVLKVLALAPGHRLHREAILDRLWPDLEPRAATNNLHGTLHLLRHALEPDRAPGQPSDYLPLDAEAITLRAPAGVWIDLEAFELAATVARASREPAAYEAAIDLYTGELLPEDPYADWAAAARDAAHERYLGLLLELAGRYEQVGESWAAVRCLDRVVAAEPTHEDAHASLMRLFALLGQRHRALRQYRQLEGALRRDLDAAPDPTTTRLFEAIARGDLAASPAAASRQRAPAWAVRALSHREQQVAALIARGLTNREIARTLGLSPRTADTHVGHILHKVGARSRAELADWAARGHLSRWPA